MFTVLFMVENEGIGHEREWPAVPRIGESILLHRGQTSTNVVDVVWHEMPDGVQVRVHLGPNVLKSIA